MAFYKNVTDTAPKSIIKMPRLKTQEQKQHVHQQNKRPRKKDTVKQHQQ
jgi:hypothetical protein